MHDDLPVTGLVDISFDRKLLVAGVFVQLKNLNGYSGPLSCIAVLTDARKSVAHRVLPAGHPLLLLRQQVVLPHIEPVQQVPVLQELQTRLV